MLRSTGGAFDLPSILVGVVVVGILTAGVLASIFGVIPFAQDSGARQDLFSYRTAEGVAKAKDSRYLDSAGLGLAGYVQKTANTAVGTDAAGTCYVGVAISGSGKMFYSTDKSADPQELTTASVTGCVSWTSLQTLVTAAGGTLPSPDSTGTKLMSWGIGNSGQNGSGSSRDTVTPGSIDTRLTGSTFKLVAAGEGGACAYTGTDTYCWGDSWDGQGGNGAVGVQNFTPVKVSALSGKTVTAITGGYKFFCAIADGDVYCWGTIVDVVNATPVKVSAFEGKTVTSIEAGKWHVCAVANTDLYCWGDAYGGALGTEGLGSTPVPALVPALAGKSVTVLAAGDQFTCATASGGTYCWGDNSDGQLGTGDLTTRPTPVAVTALDGKKVTALASGDSFACALADGLPYCWGDNTKGQLGLGDWARRSTPSPVAALSGKTITNFAGSSGELLCVLADAVPYCWGHNMMGALGTGDTVNRNIPTRAVVLDGQTVQSMSVGAWNTYAIIK